MPHNKSNHRLPPAMAIPAEISRLSNREAGRLLAQAEQARLAEIGRYWALCRSHPERALAATVDTAPIVRDIFRLACDTWSPPTPSAIPGLASATAQLMQVEAIQEALAEEIPDPMQADSADLMWTDGRVVGLKTVGAEQVRVLRYDGPLFNPGTVPEDALAADENGFLVCLRGDDGAGGEYEFLTAYVIGRGHADGYGKNDPLDLQSRNELMRDLPAMEALVECGQLSGESFDVKPLPTFPASYDLLIAQLQAHKAALRLEGAMTLAQQAIVDGRTRHLHARAEALRQQVQRIEDALHDIRGQIAEAEACALEEETGLARGERILHEAARDEGVLEIVHIGGFARFRLRGTNTDVTEEIRRGEWTKVSGPRAAF